MFLALNFCWRCNVKTKLLVFTVFFLWVVPTFAEMIVDTAWVRRYNGPANFEDHANAIAVDNSSNVYVTGIIFYDYETFFDCATIKYYPNGDTAWVRRYNGPGNSSDGAYAIAVDDSGNSYVTGQSGGSGTRNDYVTIKYYPNGDTAWVRRYNGPGNGDDIAYAIVIDSSGNIYVTGQSYGSGTRSDYATIKYYPEGDIAWVRRYNGPRDTTDYANAIAVDGSGNVCVTGESYGSSTNCDDATISYYPNGDTAWVRRYNGPGNSSDGAWAIAVDSSGNIYVTGWSMGIGTGDDYATIKYYPNGDTAWVRRYNGPGNSSDVARAIAVEGSGNVYVTGWCCVSGSDFDYATIKYYPNGDTAWVRRYNGPANSEDGAYAIAVDSSGNVYVTGGSEGDYATIKYFPSGDTAWARRYNGPGNNDDYANAIAVDVSGNVHVTGRCNVSGSDYDYATIKYFQVLRGDVNRDGMIDVGDVVFLINYLFRYGPSPEPLQTGNTNCIGGVDVGDVVVLINYLFKGGPPPSC